MIKKVFCPYTKETDNIDYDRKKLLNFDNRKNKIVYSAPRILKEEEKDCGLEFWMDFCEEGIITDFDQKISAGFSPFDFCYASIVNFDSDTFDKDKKIYNTLYTIVKNEQDKYFDELGDYREGNDQPLNKIEKMKAKINENLDKF